MERIAFRFARPLIVRYWSIVRGLTLGVRGAVFDSAGGILLVKHSYVPGWHLPGGGVEVGESAVDALGRELYEEAHITMTGTPLLHGFFHHPQFSKRDHVAVYVVRNFDWAGKPERTREIVDCGFFSFDKLPMDVSPGTRRRLEEILHGAPLGESW